MQVILSKNAHKQFERLPKSERNKIQKKLFSLKIEPFAGKKLTGKLEGRRSLKAWPYRIIYFINEENQRVEIIDILHRQGVYK